MSEAVNFKKFEAVMIERHTKEVYDKLKDAYVAVAGLGGLGSNIAVSLARAGIGHLLLVDFDTVDMTNINRQQYFLEHIGMKKTDALKSILMKINPYLEYRTECVKVTEENAVRIFADYPIVCEAFDSAENKAMLVNALLTENMQMKIVAGSGMAGYGNSNSIVTRKITDNFYLCGDGKTDMHDVNGLMAPRVAVCAGHQANMVLDLILNTEE